MKLRTSLLVAAMLGAGLPFSLRPHDQKNYVKTKHDLEALEKARRKRERKKKS